MGGGDVAAAVDGALLRVDCGGRRRRVSGRLAVQAGRGEDSLSIARALFVIHPPSFDLVSLRMNGQPDLR